MTWVLLRGTASPGLCHVNIDEMICVYSKVLLMYQQDTKCLATDQPASRAFGTPSLIRRRDAASRISPSAAPARKPSRFSSLV